MSEGTSEVIDGPEGSNLQCPQCQASFPSQEELSGHQTECPVHTDDEASREQSESESDDELGHSRLTMSFLGGSLPSLDNDESVPEETFVLPQAAYDAADEYLLCSICGKTEFCGYCDDDQHAQPGFETHERESIDAPGEPADPELETEVQEKIALAASLAAAAAEAEAKAAEAEAKAKAAEALAAQLSPPSSPATPKATEDIETLSPTPIRNSPREGGWLVSKPTEQPPVSPLLTASRSPKLSVDEADDLMGQMLRPSTPTTPTPSAPLPSRPAEDLANLLMKEVLPDRLQLSPKNTRGRAGSIVLDDSNYPINRPRADSSDDEESSSSSDQEEEASSLKSEFEEHVPEPELPKRDLQKEMEVWKERESKKGPKEYDLKHVLIVQSLVRRKLAKKVYSQRVQMANKRKMVATEIHMTEKSYVAQLSILVDVFLGSLKTADHPALNSDQQKAIFSQVEVILGLAKVLNEEVEKRVKTWNSISKMGDIFNKLKGNFMWYTSYVNNYDAAIQMVHDLEHNSQPFKDWVKKCEANPKVNFQDFASFLILPIQRIPRYEMLVGSLFKATWPDHPDYEDLQAAAAAMKAISQQVNKTKKTAEQVSGVLNVQKSILGKHDLVSPHRRFAREADFCEVYAINYTVEQDHQKAPAKTKIFTMKRTKAAVLKKVHLVLFNDALLLSTPAEKDKKDKNDTRKLYDFEALELLANVDVACPPEYAPDFLTQQAGLDIDISLCFQLTSSSKKYVYIAPSSEQLVAFFKDLSHAVVKARSITAKKSSIKTKVANTRVDVTPDVNLLTKFNPSLEAENQAPLSFNAALLGRDVTEIFYAGWINLQTKTSKDTKRLLAISPLRICTYNTRIEKFELDRHILEIKEVVSHLSSQLLIGFGKESLKCTANDADLAISAIQRAWWLSFPDVSPISRFTIDVRPATRVEQIRQPDLAALPCGGFASTYRAINEFYFPYPNGPLPRRDVLWDLENLPHWLTATEFDFSLFENNSGPEYRASFVSLIAALRFNTFFSALNVNGFKFENKEEWEKVCEAFKYNPKLEKLSAENCQIQGKDLSILFASSSQNKRSALVALNLNENALGDKAVQAFAAFLAQETNAWHTVELSNNKLSKTSVEPLIQAISKNSAFRLTHFNLSQNRLDKTGPAFTEWLSKPNTLEVLNLKDCRLPLSNFGPAALCGCALLETLELSGNKFSQADVLALGPFLAQTKTIKTLNFANCSLLPESAAFILETIGSNLMVENVAINLASNNLRAEGAATVGSALVKLLNVVELNLDNNEFGEEGTALIAKNLISNIGLTKLSLRNAFSGKKSKTITIEDAVSLLIDLVRKQGGVTDLCLASDRLGSPARNALFPLLFGLDRATLLRLDISGNEIGHKGAVILGNVLESNTTLQELLWDENSTDLDAFVRFSKSLVYNKTLTIVQLPLADITVMQPNEQLREAINRINETLRRNLATPETQPGSLRSRDRKKKGTTKRKSADLPKRKSSELEGPLRPGHHRTSSKSGGLSRKVSHSASSSTDSKLRAVSSSSTEKSSRSSEEKISSKPDKPEKKVSHHRSKSNSKLIKVSAPE